MRPISRTARGLLILAAAIVCAIGLTMALFQDAATRQAPSPTSETEEEVVVEPIEWQSDLDSAFAQAEQEGKLVLLEYTSDRCRYSARMESETLSEPSIISAVQQFVPVRAFPDDSETKERYNLNAPPSYLVLRPDGEVLTDYIGYRPSEVFLVELENAIRKDRGEPLEAVPTVAFSIGGN